MRTDASSSAYVVGVEADAGVAVATDRGGGREHRVQHRLLGGLHDGGEERVQVASAEGDPVRPLVAVQPHPGAEAEEDLAAAVMGHRARTRQAEADPAREPGARGAVDGRVRDDDAQAGAGGLVGTRLQRREEPAERQTGHDQLVAYAEVGEQQDPDGVAGGRHARRGADAALEAEAGHPGAGADSALGGRLPRASGRHGGGVGSAYVVPAHLHPPTVVEVGVVALADDRDHHVVGDAAVALELDLAGGVVDPSELHGRGQVDRGLGSTPTPGQ